MRSKIAIIGAGLVGRGWAIVFARAGHKVALFDMSLQALTTAQSEIRSNLSDLQTAGLVQELPERIMARIEPASSLKEALAGAAYVQENVVEAIQVKRELFSELDSLAGADAILASSSSGIMASAFTEGLKGRQRCLIAHPLNPPYLIPLVELAPAPWTTPDVVERSKTLLESVGQVPVIVKKEVPGFVLNRLQGALLNEALRLAAAGYMSSDDIDKTVSHGLGLRWSFMGPFETIDLNAPEGLGDYARRYGPMYRDMLSFWNDPNPWHEDIVGKVELERRAVLAKEALGARRRWRDRRLMALAAYNAEKEE